MKNLEITAKAQSLPDGWQWFKIKDVATVINGTTPESVTPEYWNGDIVWITPVDLGKLEDKLIRDSDRRISKAGFDSCNLTIVPSGSVVLSSRAPIGHLGIAAVPLCTNQGCKSFVPRAEVDSYFLYYALKRSVWHLQQLGSGATFSEVSKAQLERFEIPLPPIDEQKRIVSKLQEQMAAIDRARAAAEARLEAAQALPTAYLREVFKNIETKKWQIKMLHEVATLLPSKSISSDGDTEVQAITTACLSESGFLPSGIKTARMWDQDADKCVATKEEILIARSNTEDLVGRVAMFTGEPAGVVASDLTIRIWANEGIIPAFLTAYLSYLYQTGYWKNRAGGASGSMKKITRGQINRLEVPIPKKELQRSIVESLDSRIAMTRRLRIGIEEELATVEALPTALLHQAFNGEI